MGRHSLRQSLASNAYSLGGHPARIKARDLLRGVPDIKATGYRRSKAVAAPSEGLPHLECPVVSAARLIAALHERDIALDEWFKWSKGSEEILFFSHDRDAVLARLLLSE